MRDEEKARRWEREREQEGTRERGIITTITLPPWDRFREEEKGEEKDGEEDNDDEEEEEDEEDEEEDGRNGLVVANERYRTTRRETEMPTVSISYYTCG